MIASIPFTGYEAGDIPVLGMGEVGYYYATGKSCNTQRNRLTKPIIILDGFDAGDKRPIGEIYGDKLAYLNGIITENLGLGLRGAGYDIIVLNFPVYNTPQGLAIDGGADYIERNAMVLIKLIQNINTELRADGIFDEKLVIVGPSMGGLISRYALAYMEKNGMNHNTRLWVSFDSPHNGATIPIGSQKLLEKLGSAEDAVGSPATKQLLLMHYTSPVDKENWYRNIFKSNLSNNGLAGSDGFPKNLRKVALINGQLQGIQKYPGITSDYMNITLKKGVWTTIGGLSIPIFRFLIGAELFTYCAPANNNVGTVHKTQLNFLNFIGLQAGNTNALAYDSNGSIDKAPGGYYNSSQEVLDGFKKRGIAGVVEIDGNVSYPNICFIPSKSGLAYKGTNTDFFQNLSSTNLVCNGETPFDNYFAPNQDEDHVSISAASAAWLFAELNRSPQYTMPLPPTVLPSPIQLITDAVSCVGSVITCEAIVANNAANSNIIWKVQTGNGPLSPYWGFTELSVPASVNGVTTAFVPNTNNKKITITGAVNGFFGTINISAQSDGTACTTYQETNKSVHVSSAPMVVTGFFGGDCYNTDPSLTLWASLNTNAFMAFDYEWEIAGVQVFTYGIYFIQIAKYLFVPHIPQTLLVRARVKDPCSASGWSAWASQWITTNSCAVESKINNINKKEITEEKISVFPNPSTSHITIDNVLAGSEVKIYTKMGILVHSEKSENDKICLDISKLTTDLYILEAVLPNKVKVRKQIVKE